VYRLLVNICNGNVPKHTNSTNIGKGSIVMTTFIVCQRRY